MKYFIWQSICRMGFLLSTQRASQRKEKTKSISGCHLTSNKAVTTPLKRCIRVAKTRMAQKLAQNLISTISSSKLRTQLPTYHFFLSPSRNSVVFTRRVGSKASKGGLLLVFENISIMKEAILLADRTVQNKEGGVDIVDRVLIGWKYMLVIAQ